MLHQSIVLIDRTHTIAPADLTAVAAAISKQVQDDLPKYWPGISASVTALRHGAPVPAGVWPVLIVDTLPPGEGGYHWTRHNQPFAKILGGAGWSVDASHEILEMLVDPWGNRIRLAAGITVDANGNQIDSGQHVEYLVEACDPCEAITYKIDGIDVSDFITPNFYDAKPEPVVYSFTGAITKPREVLEGGYISWVDPITGQWSQLQFIDSTQPPQIVPLGMATGDVSFREFVGEMGL